MCKICHLPCCEAQQSECCGSIYCKCDIHQLKATKGMELVCPICHAKDFITYPKLVIDHEIQQLIVYCPDKEASGCDWTGKLKDVEEHYSYGRECETECEKCKTTVKHKLLHSHLDTECPCYCPYCDITAERELISSEHKEKCHKFPVTHSAKLDKHNNSRRHVKRRNVKKRSVTRRSKHKKNCHKFSLTCSDITDKHNKSMMLNQLCSIRSYLIITIFIALAILMTLFSHQHKQQPDVLYIKTELDNTFLLVSKEVRGIDHKFNETQQFTGVILLDEDVYGHKEDFIELQQHTTHALLEQKLSKSTAENQQYYYYKLSSSVWSTKLWFSWLLSKVPNYNQIAPAILKMSGLTKMVKDKQEWYSSPFLAFEGGYQMCMKVYAAGYDCGEGTHVSIYLFLMKGPHDDELEQSGHWPLRGTFTIELLNQIIDYDHYSLTVQLHPHLCSECTDRVLEGMMANSGRGRPKFMSLNTLLHSNNPYHISDSLIFRISYEDIEPPYQVIPVTFKLTHFSKWLENKEVWYSSPFFAFDGGYQMHLEVYAAGIRDGEGTHVSTFLVLTRGPYDDKLEQSGHWPLRGTFTLELLNQLNDSVLHTCMVQFHNYFCENCTNRVLDSVMACSGLGQQQFISHTTLYHNGYVKSDSLKFKVSYEGMEPPHQIAPAIFKLTKFSQWVKSKKEWYSSPFFAFNGGYQMCLNVDAAGQGDGEGTHVSVYLELMKGPHDDELEQSGYWPMTGTFTIELLNQLDDNDHFGLLIQLHPHLCSECTNRVLEGVITYNGYGRPQFISHDNLLHHSNATYYKDDSLVFRISYEDTEPPYQVAPTTFKLTHFSKWLINKEVWYSSPFFAFNGGYQMHLEVYAAGYDKGEGTHVSVYLYLMKGPHDDELEQSGHWPLRGTFTIELLNQLNDCDHRSHMVQFHHHLCEECTNRVIGSVMAYSGLGHQQFISHTTLYTNSYMKNDSLIFRISYENIEPPHQLAPVTSVLTKFSQWVNNKKVWYSSPFFAFNGGYQMCLKVAAAGSGKGEGTHVSVYLYLMKGPHDDELEHSGHWPLRGTFTIELLNQLNNSDHHHIDIVQFHHHLCTKCSNRVLEGVMASSGRGNSLFISYDNLQSNIIYYKDDSLIFSISYEDTEPPYQVAPIIFKLTHFSKWLENKEVWYSSPFFAFDGGYSNAFAC